MARASRCESTVSKVFGLVSTSTEAIIAVVAEMNVLSIGFVAGALWGPSP